MVIFTVNVFFQLKMYFSTHLQTFAKEKLIKKGTGMKYGFGIDLGGTTVKIASFQETGECLDQWEIFTNCSDEGVHILPEIAASVFSYLEKAGIQRESVFGMGIGVPGPVDSRGNVNRCINLGWGVFNVEQEFSKLVHVPVRALNDANAAALGEYWKGGGKAYENMVFVTLGTGVGGGIVIGGKLLFGAHGSGAEIGHMVSDPLETELCSCGKRGCVEQYCSATGIVRLGNTILNKTDHPSILRQKKELCCKDIFDAGKKKDPLALTILDRYYEFLGQFLGSLCSVIDPDVVVLGGGVSRAGKMLIEGTVPYFQKYVFHAAAKTQFSLATLKNAAGVYGAFKLAQDSFLQ